MANNYRTIKTQAGLALEAAAATNGVKIVLTQMALGDGAGTSYDPTPDMTALKNEVVRVSLNDLRQKDNDATQWTAEAIFPADQGGFTARECGLFAEDGTMFSIASIPPIYRPTPDQGAVGQMVITLNFRSLNTDNVTINIDPNTIVATRSWVNGNYLPLMGGSMLGPLTVLNSDGTVPNAALNVESGDKRYLLAGGGGPLLVQAFRFTSPGVAGGARSVTVPFPQPFSAPPIVTTQITVEDIGFPGAPNPNVNESRMAPFNIQDNDATKPAITTTDFNFRATWAGTQVDASGRPIALDVIAIGPI